ncbi:hypothetical protein EV426DRAFT_585045 [Tirmania nivea]|nr:hypothetical protein EV426DRAFT_585045 [Tirmania nivea]
MSDYNPTPVEQLTELGLEEKEAIDCLRASNNDVDKAADLYFSGGLPEWQRNHTWDERAFHSDRYDDESLAPLTGWGPQNLNVNNPPHYSIQGPDVLTPEVLGGPPRTRPSSPMNPGLDSGTNRDIVWAIQMKFGDNYNPDYSAWGNQETGITGTHSTPTAPTFGPATRPTYDSSQWALTTIPATREIYIDPAHPSDRQRKEGEPAFFKPSSDGFHLGPALAIFHSIPAAREALLAPQCVVDDYGYNERWWSGEKIEGPRITNIIDHEGTDEMVAEPEPSEVVLEVQRLIAFLDRTMRGYGSVDSLAKMQDVYEQLQGDQVPSFFKKWSTDIKQLSGLDGKGEPSPFTSTAIQSEPFEMKDFQVLTIPPISNDRANAPFPTLYSAIDQMLWYDQDGVAGDIYLDPIADVFCISMTRETSDLPGLGLDLPVDLYLDRYTAPFVDLVRGLKLEREKIRNRIRDLEKREEKLLHCRSSKAMVDTSTVETARLFEAAIEHIKYLKLSPGKSKNEESDDVVMETRVEKPEEFSLMNTELKGILDRLKVRLEELAASKEKARKTLHELTTAFTSPETTPESAPPLKKHSLRGVFIDLSTTFIKVQRETEERAITDEWWCLTYPLQWEANANTAAYKVMKATEKEVLDAVKYTGDGKVLLVYATEEAMQPRESDGKLPAALKTFVEQDNIAFMQELETAGDKGKRKRSNWWDNNNSINPSNPRISTEGHDTMMDVNDGTGLHQPPASPMGFTDAAGSPVASSLGPPQKKSSTGEWSVLGARDESTGEHIEDHGSLLTGDSMNNVWAFEGEPAATGRGWERMEEGTQANDGVNGEERSYDGNFVATSMSPFMSAQPRPEVMGFERIGDEDENMMDAQHVEFVEGNGEQGESSAAADGAWTVFMDESKSQ